MGTENLLLTNGGGSDKPRITFTPDAPPSGRVCIPNINTRERRKRLYSGVASLVIGLGVLAGLLAFGAGRGWRVILLPFLWSATVGFFQWRDHT